MKRWALGLLLFSCVLSAAATTVQAGRRKYPPRYRYSSYSETIVRTRNGHVTLRQVYPGYVNGFPPPAFLYYGYPHSGDGTGIGF
jgi:hypothetical protein